MAVGLNGSWHIPRIEEVWRIRVNQALQGRGSLGESHKLGPAIALALLLPLALAFLEGSDNHQPGKMAASVLIPDQPAAQYHADRAVLSCSMLKPLRVSPAHFPVAQVAGQGQQLGL